MASPPSLSSVAILLLLSTLISPSLSLTCTSQKFSSNKLYQRCSDLPQLSSYLHWTYNPADSTLSVAFVAPPPSPVGWVSWAINPTGTGMVGSQALVAFRQPTGQMTVRTFNISSYSSIVPSDLAYEVTDLSADASDGMMRIFATFVLPKTGPTTVNQVWQVGATVTEGFPAKHDVQPANLNSRGTLDLLSGQTTAGEQNNGVSQRNIHGILNAVSWGTLFPIGIVMARYLRTFESADPAWFYLHVSCQCIAYVLGVAGWGTGLKLGSESAGITYSNHRNIGIALFCLATVQVFALLVRPKKDHKYRYFWNIYHHSVGYAILVLGVVNVFKGLDIFQPAKPWRLAYVAVIVLLGAISLLLETVTWAVVLKRKKSTKS